MDRIDLALLLARRATLLEAHSAEPDAPVVEAAGGPRRWWRGLLVPRP